jgi:hypothetical protein
MSARDVGRVGISKRLGVFVRSMLEYDSCGASSKVGMFASQVPMPLLVLVFDELCSLGLFLPLRGVSPRTGSSESGRGIVVLLSGCDPVAIPSLDTAVMHERSRRTAWSNEESLSRAVELT